MYPLAEQWSFITQSLSLKVSTLAASTFGPHSPLICSWRIHAVMWIQIHIEFGSEFRILAQFGSGLCYKFRLNNLNNFRENHFTFKSILFQLIRTKCHLKKLLVSWVSELNFTPFASILSYIYIYVWIRIRIRNTDSDPQSSWIRIQ